MQQNIAIVHHLVGTVYIHGATGALSWDHKSLDPVTKGFVKRYLFDEGFVEQALGLLDPVIDPEIPGLLNSLTISGS